MIKTEPLRFLLRFAIAVAVLAFMPACERDTPKRTTAAAPDEAVRENPAVTSPVELPTGVLAEVVPTPVQTPSPTPSPTPKPPPPVLTSLTPSEVNFGSTEPITVHGDNLLGCTFIFRGTEEAARVVPTSETSTTLVVDISLLLAPDLYDFIAIDSHHQEAVLRKAFTVVETPQNSE
jgi:hypothetical protein